MAGRAPSKVEQLEREAAPVRYCSTVGCEQRAQPGRAQCEACEGRLRHERAVAWCEARGLKTVDDMRRYCARLARSIGRPPRFEVWAKNITQRAVDLMLISAGESDKAALERLREHGAIDEANKVVPLEERAKRAEARRALRQRMEEELKARGIVA